MKVATEISNKMIGVNSETGLLKKVLIHRPDYGIERVTPENAINLLYEDIVYLPKMLSEHDIFTKTLRYFVGPENVIDAQDLLAQALEDTEIRKNLLYEVQLLENLSNSKVETLRILESDKLATILIAGVDDESEETFFNPLPNFIFTRDIGVVIHDHILITRAEKEARKRETILSKYILSMVASTGNNAVTILELPDKPELTIEGGDIMMLEPGHLLVSSSERTSEEALNVLTNMLFEKKVVNKISRLSLPKLRYCMHVDTIFTKFDKSTYVGFAPFVCAENAIMVTQLTDKGETITFSSLKEMVLAGNSDAIVVPSGGGLHPYAEREQWTDSCNLVAVKAGVAFSYDRNFRTNEAFKEAGYKVIPAKELIQLFEEGAVSPKEVEKTIITLPSSEISRARGGPHCMTMPLLREDF